jgi:methyl-accepting chemotaxis protein
MVNLKNFIRLLALIVTVAVLVEGVVVNFLLEDTKINGPVYQRITADKDLLADILPPPAYVIESYLVLSRCLLEEKPAEIRKLAERIPALKEDYEKRRAFWSESKMITNAIKAKLTTDSHQHANSFFNIAQTRFLPAITSGEKTAAHEAYTALSKTYEAHRAIIDEVVTLVESQAKADENFATQSQAKSLQVVLGGELAILLGVYLAIYLLYRSTIPSLRSITEELALGAEQSLLAAEQVARASQRLAEGASEQAAAVEETGASLEEMSSMIHSTANNALQAKNMANEAQNAAQSGSSTMVEMTAAMKSIESSSAEVAKIVKSIDEIAFQTNILALNAAVEAARAGEAGAGFAVVADEVRSLAQRSAAAANETAEKIEAAILNSRNGSKSLIKVGDAFTKIGEKVRQTDAFVAEIALAAKEQSLGIEQISAAIGQMSKVTQSNASNSEQCASAAEELSAQSSVHKGLTDRLGEIVGISDASGPATHSSSTFGSPAAPAGSFETSASGAPNKPQAPGEKSAEADEFKDF